MTKDTDEGRARSTPIALVGIGCRFPGSVRGPEELWALLREGRDALVELAQDRKAAPGARGLLPRVTDFDRGFFGMSAREARAVDPQQRLLMEVAWEALEDAAISPYAEHGDGAVFVALHSD